MGVEKFWEVESLAGWRRRLSREIPHEGLEMSYQIKMVITLTIHLSSFTIMRLALQSVV